MESLNKIDIIRLKYKQYTKQYKSVEVTQPVTVADI